METIKNGNVESIPKRYKEVWMQLFKKFLNLFKTKYYIYSDKHTNSDVRIFWRKNRSGYTMDLNLAGIYYEEDVLNDKEYYPLLEDFEDLLKYRKAGFDTFYVKKKDVEKVLGRKMKCILN